jgi:hypothetical protein
MAPLPRAAVGRAFIATSSDGAVRMVRSSLPRARQLLSPRRRQLSLPRLRRSWLPQFRSFAAPATAGIRASVAASFCEAAANQIWFHINSEPHFGRGSFFDFRIPMSGPHRPEKCLPSGQYCGRVSVGSSNAERSSGPSTASPSIVPQTKVSEIGAVCGGRRGRLPFNS